MTGRDELLEIIARSKKIDELPENFTLNPEDYLIIHSMTRDEPLKQKISRILSRAAQDATQYTDEATEGLEDALQALQEDIYLRIGEEILDLIEELDLLEDFLSNAFKDGIIDELESSTIGRYIQSLNNEKSDIDGRFGALYSSEYLSPDHKEDLSQSKISYDTMHSDLVTFIQSLVDQGEVSAEEEIELAQKFAAYRDELKAFTEAYELAYNRIAEARIDAIKIGTQNILLNSKNVQLQQDGNFLRYRFSVVDIRWDNEVVRWDNPEIRWDHAGSNVSTELLEGDHIVSLDVVSNVSQAITLRISDDLQPTVSSERVWELEAGRKTRVYVHIKAKWNNLVLDFEIEKHAPDSVLEISGIKLAEGNKSDSYSQAPEDIEKEIEKTREELTESYQKYADAEAEKKALEARIWADGKMTALEKMLLADATAKANAARRYSEALDVHYQILAEAYADGKIDALEAELIGLSEDNLEAAQAYVDAQIELEKIRSDAYADAQIEIERQRAIDDANQKYADAIAEAADLAGAAQQAAFDDASNKYDAAVAHANAQALLAQQTAEAYADGIVDDEEAARIQALEAYETAAQAYADAAQQLAETNAAAYADGVITDVEAALIADATAKMNEAKQLAQDLADALDIRVDDAFSEIEEERDRAIADAQQKYEDAVEEAGTLADAAKDAALQDASNKYDAAISHAEAEALLAKQEAIAHADGIVTAEEAARIQALIDYEAAAEAYAEAAAELAEINAKAYADDEISDAEQRAIDDATAKMNEAKDLMNSLADALQTDIDDKNAYLLQLAADNLQAAQDYAESQDALLQTSIEAYADGIVTDAEARMIAAAEAEAQAAKDYAEAQDALLDTAIKAYADGEISDAEARAIADAEAKVAAVLAQLDDLRSDLEGEIGNVSSRLDTMETVTLDALEDDILTAAEIADLRVEKSLLDKEKNDVDRRYQMIISNEFLTGTAQDELEDAEGVYQATYNNLSDYYNDIFATGEIPPGDPSSLIQAYSDALADFSAVLENALTSISKAQAELAESNAIDYADTRLNEEIIPSIDDVQGAADALQYLTEKTFWDGIFEESEIQAYRTHIEPLNSEKEDLYSKYAVVYHNEFLTGQVKDELYNAYDSYDNVHEDLVTLLASIEPGEVLPSTRQAIQDAFAAYRNALNALRTAFEQASIAIEVGRIDNIIVGTRNLLLNADDIEFQNESSSSLIYKVSGVTIRWDNAEIRWDNTEIRWDHDGGNVSSEDLSGFHAFGVNVMVPTQRVVTAELRDGTKTVKREYLVPAGKKTRIGVAIEAVEGTTELVLSIKADNISQLQYDGVKLEIGNKWTDFNDSPEDVRDRIETARKNAQSAAEAYAKAEAEKQALEVKAHADGQITKMERRLLDHADAVANAARRYSQAEDQHLQILLEAYADGEVDNLEESLIQLSEDNLEAAQQAAIAAANAAETAAKAHADGIVTDQEVILMGYADQAAEAAKAHADAQDIALQGALQSYADGVVDAEEAARNAALAAYATAAEDYADAAKDLAVIAAEAYADGEIDDLEARAIADATAKMNEAKEHAQNLINDIQIGGVNLVRQYNKTVNPSDYAIGVYTLTEAIPNGAVVTLTIKGELGDGKDCWGIYNSGGSVNMTNIYPGDTTPRGYYRKTFTWNRGSAPNTQLYIYQMPNGSNNSNIEWVMLEYGNIGSEGSPAPIDVMANIQQARAIADELAEKSDFLLNKVDGRSIATGALQVGSPGGGANAGISGVTDKGTESIRFWGGGNFDNRYKARWRSFDNGTNEFGGVGTDAFIRIGIDEFGEPIIEFIRDDGGKAWSLGLNGIAFTNFQPERFRLSELLYLGNSSSDSSLLSNFNAALFRNYPPLQAPLPPDQGGGTQDIWNCFIEPDTDRYRYFAGNNFTSDTNRHLEAYHFARENKNIENPVNLVSDGWYMTRMSFQVPASYDGFMPYEFSCFRILNGLDVEGGFKTVQFFPDLFNIPIVYQ